MVATTTATVVATTTATVVATTTATVVATTTDAGDTDLSADAGVFDTPATTGQ